ncbi:MAG: glycoside hydrolase family 9 protein [Ruminococcus flavefaciens]|nr:glycoside hydrolase family 9 protein [Ruminococcus flavefaciens]MCM1229013.1 glycoside hydrolase family 9 protein [Ruminococcus flavefaciens]
MHKKISKAIAGSLMSAAMLATSVTSIIAPMTASAGQQLGQTDFEDGTGLPWHVCETAPAKQHFDIENGKYIVTIDNQNGGNGRWDLQLRHRGLSIVAGHTYEISGEVTASAAGWLYSKVGNYAGNKELWHNISGQEWQPVQLSAGQTLTFKDTFTASETLEVAEWAFHYANNNGAYGNNDTGMPDGSTLTFDNLSLIDTTSNENDADPTAEYGVVRPKTNVRLNQVGYYQALSKKASYVTDASSALDFDVVDSTSGEVVYSGKTTVFGADPDSGTSADTQVTIGGLNITRTRYKDSGANVHICDFSELDKAGTYKLIVHDTVGVSGTQSGIVVGAYDTKISGDQVIWTNWKTNVDYVMNESHEFRIDNSIYDGVLRDSFNYYYQNRSGIPIESAYITSGDKSTLAHSEYGHNPDKAYVQPKWQDLYNGEGTDVDKKYQIEATYGWYDAGDHGKYVVNGGVSVWTLQNAYEMSKKLGTDSKWTDGSVVIPEGGDNIPDALQEAKVELDWFFDMIVDSKDPYYGKDAGMVYHKLHDHKWTGLAIHAWAYEGFEDCIRIVKPPTYAATLNMVACAAQASRLWEEYDSAYAKKCLEYAEAGYQAVLNSGDGWKVKEGSWESDVYFAPLDQAKGGGPYGDTYVYDDMYWAASELFITTGDTKYQEMMETYSNPNDSTGTDKAYSLTYNLGGGENKGSLSSFNWGCTSGLGTLSLYLNQDKLSADKAKMVNDSIAAAADEYLKEQANQGMGIPYHGTTFTDATNIPADKNGVLEVIDGYEWGSNSFVINNAIVMAYAYDSTGEKKYIDGAAEALDYIYGRNGNDFSYVSGYGDITLTYPHHRLWCHGVDSSFPMAPAGILSGGPGSGMQDPYIGGLGMKRGTLAPQKCFVDNAEAWSVNEITINWNAPLVWMSSYMDDVAPNVEKGDTTKPSTSGTTGGDDTKTLWGDANEDGVVDVADAAAIIQSLGNKDKYALGKQGAINADIVDNGGGVTGLDALALQYMAAGKVTQPEFPITQAQFDALSK